VPECPFKLCSVLFAVVVHASCDKQESLMRGGLHSKQTSTLNAINYSTVRSTVKIVHCTSAGINLKATATVENRYYCLPHQHSKPRLGSSRRNVATRFGMKN